MAYPRRCEGCGSPYSSLAGSSNFPHMTVASHDGGTSSPWSPEQPGRILDIGCRFCGSIFRWDYFAPTEGGLRLGKVLGLLRGPVMGWRNGEGFDERPWRARSQQRRAS